MSLKQAEEVLPGELRLLEDVVQGPFREIAAVN